MAIDPATGDIIESLPSCRACMLLSPGPPKPYCIAFPLDDGGIPIEIWLGEIAHVEPLEGQVSDYVFTPTPATNVIEQVGVGMLSADCLVRHGKKDPRHHLNS